MLVYKGYMYISRINREINRMNRGQAPLTLPPSFLSLCPLSISLFNHIQLFQLVTFDQSVGYGNENLCVVDINLYAGMFLLMVHSSNVGINTNVTNGFKMVR